MRLKSFIATMLFACGMVCASAQAQTEEPSYAHLKVESVESSQRMVPDSLVKLDHNADPIALLIVESPLDNLAFEDGGLFKDQGVPYVSKRQKGKLYEYTVGFMQDYNTINVKHDKYAQAQIVLKDYAKPRQIWRVIVQPVEAAEIETAEVNNMNFKRSVIINTDNFSDLYIDDEYKSRNKSNRSLNVELEEGTHYITSRYDGKKFDRKINVNKNGVTADARFGGELTVRNGKYVSFLNYGNPEPHEIEWKNTKKVYDNMYGEYYVTATSTDWIPREASKTIKIGSRQNKTIWVDELITYWFLMYHGTIAEPLGASIGVCKKFGFMISYCNNVMTKINTTYGMSNVEQTSKDQNTGAETKGKWMGMTQITIAGGPMWRFYRKCYLGIEGGGVRYMSTKEHKIMDPDYEYKWGLSLSAKFLYRLKNLVFGVGYTMQAVKKPFDPGIANSLNFSFGLAI